MRLIDSHAHLDFYTEKPGEVDAVISRARAAARDTSNVHDRSRITRIT